MTSARATPLRDPRGATLKADHPRAIDRYIDFFGDTRTLSSESDRTESVHSDDSPER